jgi:hypothetical protein
MAKAKAKKKKAPLKAAKRPAKKVAKKPARKVAKAADVRLPVTAPVRVTPAPRAKSPGRPMPMPVAVDRPAARIQFRQPSLFERNLPPHDDAE